MDWEFGDMMVRGSHDCTSCDLGCREDGGRSSRDRMIAFGDRSAPIMLMAEFPRDFDYDAPGVYGLGELEFLDREASGEKPMVRAFQRTGLQFRSVYGTAALKCEVEDYAELRARHHVACLENHLGVEMEVVQPIVLWMTGRQGMLMAKRHLQGQEMPEMGVGSVDRIDAPNAWPVPEILLVRSPHPAQVRHGHQSYEQLEQAAAIVALYLERNIKGKTA